MTGRYYTRTGVWPGVLSPRSVGGLPLTEITIPTALKPVGYTSGMIGKVSTRTIVLHVDSIFFTMPASLPCTSHLWIPKEFVSGKIFSLLAIVLFCRVVSFCWRLCFSNTLVSPLCINLLYVQWHLGVQEYLPTNHGFDYYFGAPMTQNECVSNIKYPGSAIYHTSSDSESVYKDAKIVGNLSGCGTPYVVTGVGLTSAGESHGAVANASACCRLCVTMGVNCTAWTFHANASSCTTSTSVTPHT